MQPIFLIKNNRKAAQVQLQKHFDHQSLYPTTKVHIDNTIQLKQHC